MRTMRQFHTSVLVFALYAALAAPALLAGTVGEGSAEVPGPATLEFTFLARDASADYDPEVGAATVQSRLAIVESAENQGFPQETAGFSFGIAHDGELLVATSAEVTGVLAELHEGEGPDFLGVDITPADGADFGVTAGVLYSLLGGVTLEFEGETDVFEVTYDTIPESFLGDTDGVTTSLHWTDELGDPEVSNSVVFGEGGAFPSFEDGVITFNAVAGPVNLPFVRADANDDGRHDVADAVWMLSAIFRDGPLSTCLAAADANDDGKSDLSDAIFVFNYQFMKGKEPPSPFPACGFEAGQSPADCALQTSCE